MRRIYLLLLCSVITISNTYGQKTCTVKEVRSGEDRYCQFPFIIGRKRYDSCTDYDDDDGKKWCSTRTSNHSLSLHVHVGGQNYWGYCPDDCLKREVGACSDHEDKGFECVNPDICNEVCEITAEFRTTYSSGISNPYSVRTAELGPGCESDKTCSGYNEICCKDITSQNIIPQKPTTMLPDVITTTTETSSTATSTSTKKCNNNLEHGECVPAIQCNEFCEIITDGAGIFDVRGDSRPCNNDNECPENGEVCCQASDELDPDTTKVTSDTTTAATKAKLVSQCSDIIDNGLCVPASQCNEFCEVRTDGGSIFEVRGDSLFCKSDMECLKADEVCCQANDVPETVPTTTENNNSVPNDPNPRSKRLQKLESEVREGLERVEEAIEEVKGNVKATSLLEKVRSTLESVLEKLATLMEEGTVDNEVDLEIEFVTKSTLDLVE